MPDGRRPSIAPRLKAALDAMIWEGKDWNTAAQEATFTVSAMRKALQRAHVIQYLKEQREVFRAAINARNFHRLAEIRDQDDNRNAAVRAIQVLERHDDDAGRGTAARQPGPVLVIVAEGARVMGDQSIIDAKPLIHKSDVPESDGERE